MFQLPKKRVNGVACHVYGFHDFRRAFATVNAPRLKPEVLQRLMRHKSYQTTQKFYINPTNQMEDAVSEMPVPDALKKGRTVRQEGSGTEAGAESPPPGTQQPPGSPGGLW